MNIIESFELETLHTKLKKNYNISLLLEHTMYIFISFSIFFLLLFFQSLYHSKCFNTSFFVFLCKKFIKFKKLKRFLKLFLSLVKLSFHFSWAEAAISEASAYQNRCNIHVGRSFPYHLAI